MQFVDALDGEGAGADAGDLGAHLDEALGDVGDLGLHRGILDDRGARASVAAIMMTWVAPTVTLGKLMRAPRRPPLGARATT